MDFKLRKEQIHFKISFINEILSKVEYLTENAYFSMNENQSLKLNSLKLEMFKNKIKHDNIFFENIFFDITKNFLKILSLRKDAKVILELILDFCAIHSKVRCFLTDFKIEKELIQFVGNTKYREKGSNDGLIEDYYFSYFYWKAYEKLTQHNVEFFVNYLNNDSELHLYKNKELVIKTIISTIIHLDNFTEKERDYLLNSINS